MAGDKLRTVPEIPTPRIQILNESRTNCCHQPNQQRHVGRHVFYNVIPASCSFVPVQTFTAQKSLPIKIPQNGKFELFKLGKIRQHSSSEELLRHPMFLFIIEGELEYPATSPIESFAPPQY